MAAAMTQEHGWQECRPVLLALDGASSPQPGRIGAQAALELAWLQVPDGDRKLFHEFSCCDQDDAEHQAAVERIAAFLQPLLGDDPP
jgi:hypothetical protein